jgi:small-conductance mechanosensitive channel
MLDDIIPALGTVITVIGTIALVVIGRWLLDKYIADKRALSYQRQLFTFAAALLGFVAAIAVLPIPGAVRAQMLSVFGILLSVVVAFSSTSLVGNAMAGVMLRSMRGFRAGNFVRFDDVLGRVTGISLYHTEIQLVTRDLVQVPNSVLAQKAVRVTRQSGTFVNASVAIGYDEPHGNVEAALKRAAEGCDLTEVFVIVEELMDHAIVYRVYGLLEDSSQLMTKTSQLNRSILDTLHAAGMEVASPGLMNQRRYEQQSRFVPKVTIPEVKVAAEADIEDIAFDKAEQAESIEKLYAEQEKLRQALRDMGEDGESEDKERLEQRESALRERIEQIEGEIKAREKEKEQQRLDEGTVG